MVHRHIYRTITRIRNLITHNCKMILSLFYLYVKTPSFFATTIYDRCLHYAVRFNLVIYILCILCLFVMIINYLYIYIIYIYILTTPIVLKTFDCSRSAWTFKNTQDCMLSNNFNSFYVISSFMY